VLLVLVLFTGMLPLPLLLPLLLLTTALKAEHRISPGTCLWQNCCMHLLQQAHVWLFLLHRNTQRTFRLGVPLLLLCQ
jgi:hypothetical protein